MNSPLRVVPNAFSSKQSDLAFPELEETSESKSDGDIEDEKPVEEGVRFVRGSSIIQYNNKNLAIVLGSVIMKMYKTEIEVVNITDSTRCLIVMDEKSWFWSKPPKCFSENDFQLKTDAIPTSQSKQYFLLSDFRGGAHGRVWLACNSSGKACVIKFASNQKNQENEMKILETEKKNVEFVMESKNAYM